MTKSSRATFFTAAIILIMFVSACKAKGSPSDDTNSSEDNTSYNSQLPQSTNDTGNISSETTVPDDFPRTPNPIAIEVTLDTAHAAKTSSNSFQLSLDGTGADGSEFNIFLDNKLFNLDAENNLTSAIGTEVSLTPISAIIGLPFSQGLVTAVQFSPDGVVMTTPGMLILSAPGKYEGTEVIGFAADGDGGDFHLYPISVSYMDFNNSTTFYIDVMRFGIYGVAKATAEEIEAQKAHSPASAISQDEDDLARLDFLKSNSSESTTINTDLQNQLLRSHSRLVKPLLDNLANTNCDQVSVAAYQFSDWQAKVDRIMSLEYFQAQIDEDANALHARFVECAKTMCPICIGSQSGSAADVSSVKSMITLAAFAETLSFYNNFEDFDFWRQIGNKCAESIGLQGAGGSTGGDYTEGVTLPTPTPVGCPF